MPKVCLAVCSHCGVHVRTGEAACPFCGVAFAPCSKWRLVAPLVVLAGVSLSCDAYGPGGYDGDEFKPADVAADPLDAANDGTAVASGKDATATDGDGAGTK